MLRDLYNDRAGDRDPEHICLAYVVQLDTLDRCSRTARSESDADHYNHRAALAFCELVEAFPTFAAELV